MYFTLIFNLLEYFLHDFALFFNDCVGAALQALISPWHGWQTSEFSKNSEV